MGYNTIGAYAQLSQDVLTLGDGQLQVPRQLLHELTYIVNNSFLNDLPASHRIFYVAGPEALGAHRQLVRGMLQLSARCLRGYPVAPRHHDPAAWSERDADGRGLCEEAGDPEGLRAVWRRGLVLSADYLSGRG